jgi:DNA processing protein
MEMAETISKDLAANGFTVVSGLARGIDTAAHRGAVAAGRTIAVIGSGLADIYPPDNRELARIIAERGALLSEFSMATPPDRQNFPQRNRIVSGFTLGTLLIEAPVKSGAMITMDKARLHHKKLFALPGRADAESFKGNHLLIKDGQAHLIENAADILAHFDSLFTVKQPSVFNGNGPRLDKDEATLLERMPSDEVGIDALSAMLHLPTHHVHTTLMGLVLKKVVKEYPGKIYKKVSNK